MNIRDFSKLHPRRVSSWSEFEQHIWYNENPAVSKTLKAMCHNCKGLFTLASTKNWGPIPNIMGCWGDLQPEILDQSELKFCFIS